MEMKDYVQTVVNKFESKNFDAESQQRASEKLSGLKGITDELVEICKRLDDVKRHIFYKKGEVTGLKSDTEDLSVQEFRVLHAAVGLATEGVEFLESAVDGILYQRLDKTHLIEELGDIFWYGSVFIDTFDTSFEQIAEANVSKLNIRYAMKFSNEKALGRDLVAERAALEAATKKVECPLINGIPSPSSSLLNIEITNLTPSIANVLQFPTPNTPDDPEWEEDVKGKYIKFTATTIVVILGFLSVIYGPMFLSKLW